MIKVLEKKLTLKWDTVIKYPFTPRSQDIIEEEAERA